jgi:glycosyltransferase involved in cell wall biosynthesis
VSVSAIVCTRNRAEPIAKAVRSLLESEDQSIELIVVDQSDGDDTVAALAPMAADPRLRYVRSTTRGKGAALNEALKLAKGTIVVCTDDDCSAEPGWVSKMARELESQPSAAIAFCRVVAVEHDENLGYVPQYEVKRTRLLRSILEARAGIGLGAAMALRRDFVREMGGFDESFGPGARFPSADEWDISMRALLTGRHVYETPSLAVLHDGFRTFDQGRAHASRDWVALGAVCAKPVRAGHLRALVVGVWFLSARALWPPMQDVLRLRKPRGLRRILSFLRGFGEGMLTHVDHDTLLFDRNGSKDTR